MCLNFREFPILGLFTKFRIREFSFFPSSAIIIIIFTRFLNWRICPFREIRENYNLANITRSTVCDISDMFRQREYYIYIGDSEGQHEQFQNNTLMILLVCGVFNIFLCSLSL